MVVFERGGTAMCGYQRVLLRVGLALCSLMLVAAASASELYISSPRPIPFPPRMNVSLDILVQGRVVPLISHGGQLYLPVPRLGAEYQIRVTNTGSRRIVALVDVDGLSVITGQPAHDAQPGYIVGVGDSIVIPGWRRDRDTVAAFTFTDRLDSYAARRGYRDNIGAIRLVAIEELKPHVRPMPYDKGLPGPLGSPRASLELGSTGTGWGRDVDSSIVYVPFIRSGIRQTISIIYDTPEALRRAGVPVDYAPPPWPRPWREEGYCPPPK